MPEKTDTKQCALDRKLPGLGWISLQRGCELQVHVTSGSAPHPTPTQHDPRGTDVQEIRAGRGKLVIKIRLYVRED